MVALELPGGQAWNVSEGATGVRSGRQVRRCSGIGPQKEREMSDRVRRDMIRCQARRCGVAGAL